MPKSLLRLMFIAVDAFLYWLNQWGAIQTTSSRRSTTAILLHSAEPASRWTKRTSLNLRPIVISMAAANQVKPVEFKVAFWQLALYGEIAAIGFWFFLMLGLTRTIQTGRPKRRYRRRSRRAFSPKKRTAIPSSLERLLICSTRAITSPCKSLQS